MRRKNIFDRLNTSTLLIIIIILLMITIGILLYGLFGGKWNHNSQAPVVQATQEPDDVIEEADNPVGFDDTGEEPAESEEGTDSEISEEEDFEEDEEPTPAPTRKKKKKKKKEAWQQSGNGAGAGQLVAIDAGHQEQGDSSVEPVGPGSSTKKAKVSSGATGVSSGVPEYKLNLQIAKKLEKELIARGYQVFMIRSTNSVKISNMERAQMANKSGADIYIRIHADGTDDSSARGASALYPSTDNPYVANLSAPSKKLSQDILNAYCKKTGFQNRGLSLRDDLTGTNWSKIPVTLIEMGFLSNPSEDEQMQDDSFQYVMAEGIADGVDAYFTK